jgi:malate dehydrogenase
MAGVLDSARMRTFMAMEMGVSVENTHAFVLGGHGDTMVPIPRLSTIAGVPMTELMSKDRVDAIVKRTAGGGAEIVALLKTGSAYYAPSASTAEMVDAVLKDKHKVLPCCCYLEGEFGIKDLYVGVPAQLGAKGIEKIWEIKLTDDERAALHKSAAALKELVDILKLCGRWPPARADRRRMRRGHGARRIFGDRRVGVLPNRLVPERVDSVTPMARKSRNGCGCHFVPIHMTPSRSAVISSIAGLLILGGCLPPEWGANAILHPHKRRTTVVPDLPFEDLVFESF